MKTSGQLTTLFSCLLFLCSVAHSGISREEQFKLLSHYSNTSLVEDSLKLATSSSGLAISTVINYGLWYGICKSPEVVSALAGRFDLSGTEQNELQEVKSSFCNQLAAVITSTEVALAGHVSPWHLKHPWWQTLRYAGTAYSGYAAYTNRNPYLIPIVAAGYFTHEVVARRVAGATAIRSLRYQDRSTTQPLDYAQSEYSMLSAVAGMMVGSIVYDMMIARDVSRAKAIFAYIISHVLVEGLSTINPLSKYNSNGVASVWTEAGADVLAGTGVGALAGSWATAISGGVRVAHTSDLLPSAAIVVYTAILVSPYSRGRDTIVGMVGGLMAGNLVLALLSHQRSALDSGHLLKNVALTLAPALTLALINGFSNNAIYGYSLEESFNETVRNQWKKFHAPLDYLYTLFN
ncbi:hypothetical protein [Endozoicomonas sp. ALD040]|uniref:hypothetical protein n=1 Tax=unclassified Endozoicomonas TaxID=2644528 RepID=UPI003BAFEB10